MFRSMRSCYALITANIDLRQSRLLDLGEGCLEILRLKIGTFAEDLIRREPCCVEIEHIAHADPHAPDAGLATALGPLPPHPSATRRLTSQAPAARIARVVASRASCPCSRVCP